MRLRPIALWLLVAGFLSCEAKKTSETNNEESGTDSGTDTSTGTGSEAEKSAEVTEGKLAGSSVVLPAGLVGTLAIAEVPQTPALIEIDKELDDGSAPLGVSFKDESGSDVARAPQPMTIAIAIDPVTTALLATNSPEDLCIATDAVDGALEVLRARKQEILVDDTNNQIKFNTKAFGVHQAFFCGTEPVPGEKVVVDPEAELVKVHCSYAAVNNDGPGSDGGTCREYFYTNPDLAISADKLAELEKDCTDTGGSWSQSPCDTSSLYGVCKEPETGPGPGGDEGDASPAVSYFYYDSYLMPTSGAPSEDPKPACVAPAVWVDGTDVDPTPTLPEDLRILPGHFVNEWDATLCTDVMGLGEPVNYYGMIYDYPKCNAYLKKVFDCECNLGTQLDQPTCLQRPAISAFSTRWCGGSDEEMMYKDQANEESGCEGELNAYLASNELPAACK